MKSVYSLVLSDEIIAGVDEAAVKAGVSRSQFVNDCLAEKLGVFTHKRKVESIFAEVVEAIEASSKMRAERTRRSCLDLLSALNYKYNPRVTYTVEILGENHTKGRLKIALRTTNPVLLNMTERFFSDFIAVEKLSGATAQYYVEDGKLVRTLDFSRVSGEDVPLSITRFVGALDKLFNVYVASFGDGEYEKLKHYYQTTFDGINI